MHTIILQVETGKPFLTDISLNKQVKSSMPSIAQVGYLDTVVYPNDFPSDPSRNTLPSGLLLADSTPLKYKCL